LRIGVGYFNGDGHSSESEDVEGEGVEPDTYESSVETGTITNTYYDYAYGVYTK